MTKLPGNDAIQHFLEHCLEKTEEPRLVAYVDIDHFKAFNDKYGFELGDRAILMLASILKPLERDPGLFVGHIGGDDFFVGAVGQPGEQVQPALATISPNFSHMAESLYDPGDREAGFMLGRGRDGMERYFPLLSCTVSAICLSPGFQPETTVG